MTLEQHVLASGLLTLHIGAALLTLLVVGAMEHAHVRLLVARSPRPRTRRSKRLAAACLSGAFILLLTGGALFVLDDGSLCRRAGDGAALRMGGLCLPERFTVKLLLIGGLALLTIFADRRVLPLLRRGPRPLLAHLPARDLIRIAAVKAASITVWIAIPVVAIGAGMAERSMRDVLAAIACAMAATIVIAIVAALALRHKLRHGPRVETWTGVPVSAMGAAIPARETGRQPLLETLPAGVLALRFRPRPPELPASGALQSADGSEDTDDPGMTLDDAQTACRPAILGAGLISLLTNLLMLSGPIFMLQIYDRVLTSRSVETLAVLTILVIGLYAALGGLDLIRTRVFSRISVRLDRLVSRRLLRASLAAPSHAPPLRDLEQVRQFLCGPAPGALLDLPFTPFFFLLIFLLHPLLGLVAVIGAAVLALLSWMGQRLSRATSTRAAEELAIAHGFVEAGRRNSEAVRAMGMAGAHAARWRDLYRSALSRQLTASDTAGSFSVTIRVGRMLLQSLMLAAGAWLALSEQVSAGAMIAASIIATRALAPIEQLIGQWPVLLATRAAYARCRTHLATNGPAGESLRLPDPAGHLAVTKLYVTPPGSAEPVIKGVSFALSPGDCLAVLGSSASGKSSLARALVGVWQPRHGDVRLDGAALSQWNEDDLGRHVGYLPQDVALFDATIAENISRLSRTPDPQAILSAAAAAGVHEMILRLDRGYETRIGEGGCVLSGGQRQRIALARALYGAPALIVMDEPNASLDAVGEKALTAAIRYMCARGSTVVVMAHRQSILAAATHILILKDGRQAAFGPADRIRTLETAKSRDREILHAASPSSPVRLQSHAG